MKRIPATLVGRRNRALLLFIDDRGSRLDEFQKLDFEDLHIADGYALVWGKGQKRRVVGIADDACQALQSYMELHPTRTGAVWVTEKGSRLSRSGIQSTMRRLKKLGGNVRWSAHTFRTTWAINFMRNGGDTFSLQTLGGWTDLEMPRRYTRALNIDDALKVHRRASPGNNCMPKD